VAGRRLVLFDMDDVVYVYDRPARVAALAAMTGLDAALIEHRIWEDGLEDAADAGAFATSADYLGAWRHALGVDLSASQWMRARRDSMRLIGGTLAIIDRLQAADIAVGVLTNNGPLVFDSRFDLVPDLADRVGDRFTVSSQFKCRKPDPAVFTAALDLLGFEPADSFFIDDKPENVEGARAAGLDGHWFRNPGSLSLALRDSGIAISP